MPVRRFSKPLQQNDKPVNNKDLQQSKSGAYKPAYKDNSKTSKNQADYLPPDLADVVAVWPELPEHIKAAIKALVQTHSKGTR